MTSIQIFMNKFLVLERLRGRGRGRGGWEVRVLVLQIFNQDNFNSYSKNKNKKISILKQSTTINSLCTEFEVI